MNDQGGGPINKQTDPVCGMHVDPAHARGGTHEHGGTTYYFCNPGCRERFVADPDRYLAAPPTETDPVCGMKVKTATAAGMHEHAGTTYYFCSPGCRESFVAHPERYLERATSTGGDRPRLRHGRRACDRRRAGRPRGPDVALLQRGMPGGVLCRPRSLRRLGAPPACDVGTGDGGDAGGRKRGVGGVDLPDAPGDRQTAPGPCPICGMALEPRVVTAEEERNPELEDMTRRFVVALALTVPSSCSRWAGMFPGLGLQHLISPRAQTLVELVLATPVVLWGGWPFFQRVAASRSATGTSTCSPSSASASAWRWLFSLCRGARPGVFPAPSAARAARSAVYFESAAVIVDARAAGPGARAARAAAHERRPSARCSASLRRRRAGSREDGTGADVPLEKVERRRSAARAAGREGPGRRRGARGSELRRRVDDHRRADPGARRPGRPRHRRHAERHRRAS